MIVGASFIGLEVASSLRARDVEVHVVGPEAIPMARVLGPELGSFIRSVHEQHGVTFHLGRTAVSIDEHAVTLDNGERIDADLVVVGIGVRPAIALAEQAGLTIDRGVLVDQFLETSAQACIRCRATSPAGRIRAAARRSASSISSSPSARAKPPRATCSAAVNPSMRSRSSGPSSTTSRLPMSVMRRNGTRS